jgi:WXG100 family type VII secretion target
MGDRLRLEYDSLTQIATLLAKEAADLEELPKRIAYHADYLQRAGWSGDAAIKFFGELVEVLDPATWKMIALLSDVSNLINQLVHFFRQVEQEVAALFRFPRDPAIDALKQAVQIGVDETTGFGLLKNWLLGDLEGYQLYKSAIDGMVDTFYKTKMHEIMGRDIDIIPANPADGNKDFTAREKLLVVEAFENFPKTIRDKAQLDHIGRFNTMGDGVGGKYNPNFAEVYMADAAYAQKFKNRYNVTSDDDVFEAVVLHEATHSIQYDADGKPSALLNDYAKQFGWKQDAGGNWKYSGDAAAMPASPDNDPMKGYPRDKMNPYEDMAESVTYYRYAPDKLSWERYNWVRDNIYSGQEFK